MINLIKILLLFSFVYMDELKNKNNYNLESMSLKNKIAQMIMIRINGEFYNTEHWQKKNVINLIENYNIGGIISYTGSIHGTYYNLKEFQEISKIPLFVAADYERGIGQFIDGTLFPTNMAVSATGNPQNAFKQGEITGKEAKAIGVNMVFAPVLDINNNLNNPIINFRSYGDTPEKVSQYSLPYIKGIQSQNIIACGKHFPGHGDTNTDSHTSLPIIYKTIEQLFDNELRPFKDACDNKVRSVMIAHILFPELDPDNPATLSKKITTDILRKQWGYNGLIITDALEMGALTSHTWHGEAAVKAIEAGADIILLPIDVEIAINSIYNAVIENRITEKRINESVNRIMLEKERIGMFNKNKTTWDNVEKNIKIRKHTKIAQNIANESITLVKDNHSLIPLDIREFKHITHIMLSMDDGVKSRFKAYAKDIKKTHGNVQEIVVSDELSVLGIKDILKKVKKSDLVLISMLVRIKMDKGISTIDSSHDGLITKISKMGIPVIGVSFGSPYLPNYKYLDTYLCTYGYGSVSLTAASNAIFGRINISGKLPVTLNDKYKNGHGLEVKRISSVFKENKKINFSNTEKLIYDAINDSIFPGAQVFISKGNNIILNEGFGKTSNEKNAKNVTRNTIYDVASLTKILSTTPVLMKLIKKNRLNLEFPLKDFYSTYDTEDKKNITIRHLLTHTSGLKSHIAYYEIPNMNRESIIKNIINQDLEYKPDLDTKYSDLGMILLLDIIERVTGSKLDKLSNKYFYSPLGMHSTMFNPSDDFLDRIAPTENDSYFRNRLLQGIVHDENAYILGGVSGHAGLFSNASDIGIFCKMLLDGGYYLGTRYFDPNLINSFTSRKNIPENSDRALGWDTPSKQGSTAGDYFSSNAYGHLGFTGTSVWSDPINDVIVVLLTNRVYPTRDKKNINKKMYLFRRNFHNEVMKQILGVCY